MKQVLLVATVGGFVPQFELNNVNLLKKIGCGIHYAANFDCCVYSVTDKLLEKQNIVKHQLDISKSPFRVIKNYQAYRVLKELIDDENIELVHCHTPVGGVVARLAAARSRNKPKVIYTAHGFHFYKGAPLLNWCIYYMVEKYLARKTDVIVTINEEDYKRASKFRLRKGGSVYKIPGVGLNIVRFSRKDDIIKDNARRGIKLITIGELNKNKNHKVVIEAIAKLGRNDIYYDIYGSGIYEEKLRQLIRELGMQEYIKLKGYIEEPENALKEADCFVFPSLREGLGMSALEAMACGLPVIAKDNRGTREYMKDGYNGLVCIAGTVEEYIKAILRMVDSKENMAIMGTNAVDTAERFSIMYTNDIMQKVYNTLV